MGRQWVRIAGQVKQGSVSRDISRMELRFILAGGGEEKVVEYKGTVPDNFSEGREIVAEGRAGAAGVFQAEKLITRCESKYEAKVK